uniref:VWFD domain-containing protein n=1 Tax=Lates calcarifer TaxID=8187 RepID=A0A4W6F4H3_LATCA
HVEQLESIYIPYHINTVGIYLVIEAKNGLVLIWNKKTTLMIKLSSTFKSVVCVGIMMGNIKNDFTTRNKEHYQTPQCVRLQWFSFKKVDPQNYYDACVRDTCACNTGGDCECFCSAVAAYAAACDKAGACVRWRTPTICPVFCDFYNPDGECEWHYEPCGKPCMKTCRNPSGICCYPRCPPERPYL